MADVITTLFPTLFEEGRKGPLENTQYNMVKNGAQERL
jgi:predicted small lipoprotein YifL